MEEFITEIEEEIERNGIDETTPGLSLLVTYKGEVVLSKGYGLANVKKKIKITPKSNFDLASVSKQFTGAAIALLYQEELIDIDENVSTYLPSFSPLFPSPNSREITVKDLLIHCSGLADYSEEIEYEDMSSFTCDDNISFLNNSEGKRGAGEEWEYNNSGYALLASVVEQISGNRFDHFLKEKFFDPLQMTSTSAYSKEIKIKEKVNGYCEEENDEENEEYNEEYYEETTTKEILIPSLIYGDGNVFSNINDLAIWDYSLDQRTILTDETMEWLWGVYELDDGNICSYDEETAGYGFGWNIDAIDENSSPLRVSHGGSWAGASNYYLKDIENEVTIIVLSNHEDTNSSSLAYFILESFLRYCSDLSSSDLRNFAKLLQKFKGKFEKIRKYKKKDNKKKKNKK